VRILRSFVEKRHCWLVRYGLKIAKVVGPWSECESNFYGLGLHATTCYEEFRIIAEVGAVRECGLENAESVTQHSPGPVSASLTSSHAALGNRQSQSLYTTMSVGVPLSRFVLHVRYEFDVFAMYTTETK
jgi:hypothetical protein